MIESEPRISAIVPWFGSKRTMAEKIVDRLCPGGKPPKAFWDLCCGSMAVSLAMPRVSHHTVVDLHDDLLNLARIIQHQVEGPRFYRHCRRVIAHEGLYLEAAATIIESAKAPPCSLFGVTQSDQTQSALQRAISYFITSWIGRNGVAGTKRIGYQIAKRFTSGGGHGAVRWAGAVQSIPAWRRRMRDWFIIQDDIFEVLPKIDDQPGTSIYVDPPYVGVGDCYAHSFAGTVTVDRKQIGKHEAMALLLNRFEKARVVVSYYDHPALEEWYPADQWDIESHTGTKNLHVQNARGAERADAPEVLIINKPREHDHGRATGNHQGTPREARSAAQGNIHRADGGASHA